MVESILPKEETIIDPLYEPLKLNRYELCPHLKMLSNVSHLRYGFSPYLLFDVEGWEEVVKVITGIDNDEKMFSWDCVPGSDSERLLKYLMVNHSFGWAGCVDIRKTSDNETVHIVTDKNSAEITIYKNEEKATLKISDGKIYDLTFKIENDKLNIYEKINSILKCEDFVEQLNKYLEILKLLPTVDKNDRNTCYKDLKDGRNSIKKEYEKIKGNYQEILNQFLYDSNKFKENFEKIAHLFQLEHPVKVKCPECDEKQVTKQFMCEEGKIYSMKEALLRTFELRRARWLQMSGLLHTIHRASTHTRLAHQIGSMVAGVNALREIDMYPHGDMSMSLGEYLLMRGELHEFLMANFLHDIGHSPLSHVLEPNPFIELDHEEITRNLILGKAVKVDGKGGEMDWYVAERYLLKMKTIKDFEHRFFENRYDPIYAFSEEKWDKEERMKYFLACLKENGEILESEIVTVNEVLENFGVDTGRVIEILSGKMFCPMCGRLLEIEDDIIKCEKCNEVVEMEIQKIYDTQFLYKLIDSEIDIDRMDHVKRDSVVCGLSLTSFRLLELLGSMSVVLPSSDAWGEIHNVENNKPCILISEGGLLYIIDLLTARKSVFKDVLYSDENNWINGVVNQITALSVRYLPHIRILLPFITDQILMHFYTNDLFLGTQVEKLNKLFHGKVDYSAYGKLMRYKLKKGVIITEDNLQEIYKKVEDINDKYERLEVPAVVFYTNIKPTKCPVCGKGELKKDEGEGHKFKCMNKECKVKVGEREFKSGMYSLSIEENDKKKEEHYYCLVGIEEDLLELQMCPICRKGKIEEQEEQHFFVCMNCKKRMRKCSEEKMNWNPLLVYGKKFKIDGDKKYFKFRDLAGNYKKVSRERFPERPTELDVKNLFYVWVSDFVATDEKNDRNNGDKSKNWWLSYIKKEIGGVWLDENQIGEFEKKFVDLDNIAKVKIHG